MPPAALTKTKCWRQKRHRSVRGQKRLTSDWARSEAKASSTEAASGNDEEASLTTSLLLRKKILTIIEMQKYIKSVKCW